MSVESQKQAAAYRACEYVKDGMRLGLGSGSTMVYALQCLKTKVEAGLNLQVVCSSVATQRLVEESHIPLLLDHSAPLDLNIDGVDQIDEAGSVIKGGGAALTREKILAQWAKHTIWMMDERKPVHDLQPFVLPVEMLPFALEHLQYVVNAVGYRGNVRMEKGSPLVSDNGNYILDVSLPAHTTMREAHQFFKAMAGVVETGYFEDIDALAIIASAQGIEERAFGFRKD